MDPLVRPPAPRYPLRVTRILLYSGAGEAVPLVPALREAGLEVCGHVPPWEWEVPPELRSLPQFGGRFDGEEGMFARSGADAVLSAAHRFDNGRSHIARKLCERGGIPYLRLLRAPWSPGPGDDWRRVRSLKEARETVPPGATVFLATGRRGLDDFESHDGPVICRRRGAPTGEAFPLARGGWSWARPPFDTRSEIAWLRAMEVDWLVTRNAGGAGAWPKVAAARALGLPVAMIERPDPPGPVVRRVDEAVAWAAAL